MEGDKDADIGNVEVPLSDVDWSDCYGLAWDRSSTMGAHNETDLSVARLHGEFDTGSTVGESCSISLQGTGVDYESGYCDSLSTSTDKELTYRSQLGHHHPAGEVDEASQTSGEDMPLFVDIDEDGDGRCYFKTKSSQMTDVNANNPQIVSAKGTVRGVKNRVRSNVKRFLENKPSSCAEEQESTESCDVVVYTTSLRSIRRTHEDCSHVKKILHNNKIQTDERDVFLNELYRTELASRLDGIEMEVPVVFVKGDLLGGRDAVEKLNESGALKDLATTLQRLLSPIPCGGCGGFRFVNCPRCSGSGRSRRTRISREINSLRCTSCKKGLAPCPECNSTLLKAADLGEF